MSVIGQMKRTVFATFLVLLLFCTAIPVFAVPEYTDDQPPFTWKWNKPGFGKCLLYVKAYDEKGEFAGRDNVVLWKIM